MHLVVGIFLADMFGAGIPCSFRWWMSWLCHNTAIESDSVQLPARMSLLDPFCSVCWWRSPLGTCATTKASVCLHKAAWWRPSEKQKPRIHPQAYKHNVFNAFHNPVEDVVVSQHCDWSRRCEVWINQRVFVCCSIKKVRCIYIYIYVSCLYVCVYMCICIFYSLRDTPPAHQGEAACMRYLVRSLSSSLTASGSYTGG